MRVLGLMSGTSADGVDAVLVNLSGRVARPRWRILAGAHTSYPPELRDRLVAVGQGIPLVASALLDLGGEVWRDLDWLVDTDKVALDSGRRPELALALLQVFDSQITGGKRYDLAAAGRRLAHATFHTSHATDRLKGITWAMDLTPLVADPTRDVAAFTLGYLDHLRADVRDRLGRFL